MVYSAESMAQVELGRQGEHLARTVQIDVSCLQRAFPEAAFALVYRLPRETALYIAETELIGPLLTWAVPAQATQKAGTGRLEVRAMVGETVAKSVTAKTRVEESLTGAGETPPESAGDWVGTVRRGGARRGRRRPGRAGRRGGPAAHDAGGRGQRARRQRRRHGLHIPGNRLGRGDGRGFARRIFQSRRQNGGEETWRMT